MSATTWPDQSYLTPGRARALRTEIQYEQQMARELDGPAASFEVAKPEPPAARPSVPAVARPCARCGAVPARRYMNAWLCGVHAPIVPTPDPATTARALHERRWRLIRAMGAAS